MIKNPARLYTAVYGFLGVFQAMLSYAFHFFPRLDQTVPFLQAIPHMILVHSTLHFVTSILAIAIFFRGGESGSFWFAFGFGLFYTALGLAGWLTGQQFGLGLQPFDHPFHLFLGGLALLAAGPTLYHSITNRKVSV
jgi:hypothetical protein